MTEDALSLEAEITLSQLREEEALGKALARYHRVRLRRYSELVGVVLDTAEWTRLTTLIANLQEQVASYEESALLALVRQRATTADFEPGSAGRSAELFDDVEASVGRASSPR